MDIGGWLGLTKGKKMTAGPRSNLRKVVRTASKFCKETAVKLLVLRAHSLVPPNSFTMIYFSPQPISHILYYFLVYFWSVFPTRI